MESSPIALFSFVWRFLKWVSHVRELLRCMPRYFTLVFGLIFWSLTLKLSCLVIVLSLVLKIIISVLLAFRDILLLRNHWQRCFISWFICLFIFFKELLVQSKFVSSAKWWTELCCIALWRSFIYKRNSRGPRTDPCGTLCVIGSLLELLSFICVNWCLPIRKLSSQI